MILLLGRIGHTICPERIWHVSTLIPFFFNCKRGELAGAQEGIFPLKNSDKALLCYHYGQIAMNKIIMQVTK